MPERPPAYIARRKPCGCVVHVTLSSVSGVDRILRGWRRAGFDVRPATLFDMHLLSMCPHRMQDEFVTGRAG